MLLGGRALRPAAAFCRCAATSSAGGKVRRRRVRKPAAVAPSDEASRYEALLGSGGSMSQLAESADFDVDLGRVYVDWTSAGGERRHPAPEDVEALLSGAAAVILGGGDEETADTRLRQAAEVLMFVEQDTAPRRPPVAVLRAFLRCCAARDGFDVSVSKPPAQRSDDARSEHSKPGFRTALQAVDRLGNSVLEHDGLLSIVLALACHNGDRAGLATIIKRLRRMPKLSYDWLAPAVARVCLTEGSPRLVEEAQRLLVASASAAVCEVFFDCAVQANKPQWLRQAVREFSLLPAEEVAKLQHDSFSAVLLALRRWRGDVTDFCRTIVDAHKRLGDASPDKCWAMLQAAWTAILVEAAGSGTAAVAELMRECAEEQKALRRPVATSVVAAAVDAFCRDGEVVRALFWAETHWVRVSGIGQSVLRPEREVSTVFMNEALWGTVLAACMPSGEAGPQQWDMMLRMQAHCCSLAPAADYGSAAEQWAAPRAYCEDTPWLERAELPPVHKGFGPNTVVSEALLHMALGDRDSAADAVARLRGLLRAFRQNEKAAGSGRVGAVLGRKMIEPRDADLRRCVKMIPPQLLRALVHKLSEAGMDAQIRVVSRLFGVLRKPVDDRTLALAVAATETPGAAVWTYLSHARQAVVAGLEAPSAVVSALTRAAADGDTDSADMLPTVLSGIVAQCLQPPPSLFEEAVAAAQAAGRDEAVEQLLSIAESCGQREAVTAATAIAA